MWVFEIFYWIKWLLIVYCVKLLTMLQLLLLLCWWCGWAWWHCACYQCRFYRPLAAVLGVDTTIHWLNASLSTHSRSHIHAHTYTYIKMHMCRVLQLCSSCGRLINRFSIVEQLSTFSMSSISNSHSMSVKQPKNECCHSHKHPDSQANI